MPSRRSQPPLENSGLSGQELGVARQSKELRDHLFISYASEDAALAEWLTLKLAAAGYAVWCDRVKLLGGESYPRDIERAIQLRTFRMLALLSRNSIDKDNPRKERTKALNLGHERGVDFLIPLNVDGLRASELDWMTSDLSWIPFDKNWAVGFAQLLKKLQSIDAPKAMVEGPEAVVQWYEQGQALRTAPERLWTNLLELKVPATLRRLHMPFPLSVSVPAGWPIKWEGTDTIWAFEFPELGSEWSGTTLSEVDWHDQPAHLTLRLSDVAVELTRQYVTRYCLARGLVQSADGEYVYFPPGLIANERLTFTSYTGRQSYVQVTGKRVFRTSKGPETVTYHLSPSLRPNFWSWGRPVVEIQMRVYLTNLDGNPLEPLKALRRRKRIAHYWFNHQWLTRVMATTNWLADGASEVRLGIGRDLDLTMSAGVIQKWAPVGIDESALKTQTTDVEPSELDDPDEFATQDENGN